MQGYLFFIGHQNLKTWPISMKKVSKVKKHGVLWLYMYSQLYNTETQGSKPLETYFPPQIPKFFENFHFGGFFS